MTDIDALFSDPFEVPIDHPLMGQHVIVVMSHTGASLVGKLVAADAGGGFSVVQPNGITMHGWPALDIRPDQQEVTMTTPTSPGHVPSDPMAVERLRTLLAEALIANDRESADDALISAGEALTALPTAQFIHDINSAGVPMRRVLAYGEWEMDPNPPKRAENVTVTSRPSGAAEALQRVIDNSREDHQLMRGQIKAMQDRLRAAIVDQIRETGHGSPEHLRMRYALAGEGEGAPSAEAVARVQECDAADTL